MKPEDLTDALNHLDDEIISSAEKMRIKKKSNTRAWIKWVAVAACFCILAVGVFGHFNYKPALNGGFDSTPPNANGNQSPTEGSKPLIAFTGAIYEAKYPACVPYPKEADYMRIDGSLRSEEYSEAYDKWLDDMSAKRRLTLQSTDTSVGTFSAKTVKNIFTNSDGENLVYSPVNLYIALSMLAETTDGETRTQLLDLLGVSSIEYLRKRANEVWSSNYSDDGLKTSILANSVWLNDTVTYNKATLKSLTDNYYASSFSGKMGSSKYDKTLKNWINEQTGNLLKNEASEMKFDEQTVLSLVSTVYFKACWQNEFRDANTKKDAFKGTHGNENADFMCQRMDDILYTGDGYSAVCLSFNMSGKMWFILPDEGKTPEKLLQSGAIDTILNGKIPQQESCFINLSVPKFDVSSSLDLRKNLTKLGVTNVFDDVKSDFSPLLENNIPIYVSKVNHSARVSIDEKGCTAAAFTAIMLDGMGALEEKREIDFTLDRPFIFVVSSDDKTPLFVGTVNHIN